MDSYFHQMERASANQPDQEPVHLCSDDGRILPTLF